MVPSATVVERGTPLCQTAVVRPFPRVCMSTTVIECGEVPVLDNGKVSVAPNHTEVGAVAIYENGYEFKNNRNSQTCQNDKTWSNDDLECREFLFVAMSTAT